MKLRVILSALVALVAVLVFAAGSTNVVRAEEHTVLAGHDLFETDPSETFQKIFLFPDFLGAGCDAVSDTVFFEGVPLGTVHGFDVGFADTAVERLDDATFPAGPQTIDIEIVALSLVSVAPITVTGCPGGDQSWEVTAEVSEHDPNQATGQMTIEHQYPDGGTATTLNLSVDPELTFHRLDQAATDIGPIYLSVLAGGPVVFVAQFPWCHEGNPVDEPPGNTVTEVPGLTTNFFPGIICPDNPGQGGPGNPGAGKRVKCLTKEEAKLAAHGVIPAGTPPNNHYDDDPPVECPGKVGGITEIVVDDSTPRSEGSGLGTSATVPIATAVAVIALALATGGWFVRRRLITRA